MRSQLVPPEGKTTLLQQSHQVMVPFQAEKSQPCVIWGLSLLQEQDHGLQLAVSPCLLTPPCSCSLSLFSSQPWRKGCFLCPDSLSEHPPVPFAPLVPLPLAPSAFTSSSPPHSSPHIPPHPPAPPAAPALSREAMYVMFLRRIVSARECMWMDASWNHLQQWQHLLFLPHAHYQPLDLEITFYP